MTSKKPKEKENKKPEFFLKIAESIQEDVDKGIARISSKDMKAMNLLPGDIVLIEGKVPIAVKVLRALGGDKSIGKIRLDGTVRSNIGFSIGEEVGVQKIEVKSANSVTLSPMQEGIKFSDNPTEFFHNKLMEKSLVL
ncbi:AAA family ATPase, partial [Candidatus Pacearchaeota archaeon CG_4_9_14_0_2_um_filter_30_8]